MAELDYGMKWAIHVLMKAHKPGTGNDSGKSLFRTMVERKAGAGSTDMRQAIIDTLQSRFKVTIDMTVLPKALPFDFTAPQLRDTLQMGDGEYDPASGPCEGLSPNSATGKFFDHEQAIFIGLKNLTRPVPTLDADEVKSLLG